jgi:hypothetical protein
MAGPTYQDLLHLVQSFEKDFEKFYSGQNREAGVRLRKHMQTLRLMANAIRQDIQMQKAGFPVKRSDLAARNSARKTKVRRDAE